MKCFHLIKLSIEKDNVQTLLSENITPSFLLTLHQWHTAT